MGIDRQMSGDPMNHTAIKEGRERRNRKEKEAESIPFTHERKYRISCGDISCVGKMSGEISLDRCSLPRRGEDGEGVGG